ncbi:MAG: helix-turn-helix domain-containing protein [Oscillospiraceae bacterium]|nr:helix-turn-helix domain-containing protein [Oscillospiraceae bacterium]
MFWFLRSNFICAATDLADIRFHTIFSVGFTHARLPEVSPVHYHLNYELFFVNRGHSTVRCGDRDYVCGPSDILLINEGTRHATVRLSADADVYSLQFSFFPNNKQADSFYSRLLSRLSSPELLRGQETLLTTLNLLRKEFAQQQPLYDTTVEALLQVFYAQLLRTFLDVPAAPLPQSFPITPPADRKNQQFDVVVPQMHYKAILDSFFNSRSLQENVCLAALSRELSLSAAQTRRVVKRYYGVSFQERLIQAKLQRSQFLMDTTDLSLKAIAEQCGYGSYHAFYKAFTAHTGQTPSEYRRFCAGE